MEATFDKLSALYNSIVSYLDRKKNTKEHFGDDNPPGLFIGALCSAVETHILEPYRYTFILFQHKIKEEQIENPNEYLSIALDEYQNIFSSVQKLLFSIEERHITGASILSTIHNLLETETLISKLALLPVFRSVNNVLMHLIARWCSGNWPENSRDADPFQEFFIVPTNVTHGDSRCHHHSFSSFRLALDYLPSYISIKTADELLFIGQAQMILKELEETKLKRYLAKAELKKMKRKKEQGFNHISGKDTVNSDILLKSYYSETAGKSKIKSEFLVSFAEIDSLTQAFAALPESIGQNIESPPATSAECAPEQTDNEKAEQTDNEKAEQGENRDEGNPFTSTSSEQSANQSTFSTLPSSHTHIHSFSPSISSFASLDPASIPPLVFPSALFSARISQLQQHVSHQLCGAMLLHTPLQDLFSAAWDFFFLRKGALFAAFFEALDKNQWETLFLRQSQREAALRERERKEEEEKIKEKDGMDKILNAQNKEDPESLAKRREARQNAELTQKKRRELVDCLEMCWSSAVGMCGMDELAVRNKKGREEWKGEDGEFDEEEEEEEDNDEDDLDSNDDNTRQNVVFFEDWKGDTIRSRSKMDSTITLRNHSFHSTPKQTLIPHSLFAPVLIASVFSQTNTNRSVSQPQSAKQKQSTFLLPSIPPCLRSFNAITLSFTPPFPLSLFFTPSALSIYSTAFRFLFCLSKARLNLRRVWTEKVRLFAKPSSKVEQTKLQRDKMKEKNVFFDAELLARDEAMEKTRKAVLAEVSRAHSLLSFVLNNLSVYFSEGVIGNICQAMQNEMFPANQRKNAVDELLERESGGDVEESEKKGGIIKKDESAMEIDYDHTFTPTPLRRSSSSILTTSFRSSPSSSPSYSPFSTPSRVPSSHPESDYRTETDSDSQSSSSLDFLSVMFSHEKGLMKIQTQLFLSSPSVSRSISSLIDCSEQFVSALAEFDASVFQKDRANDALREEEKKRWIKGGTQIGLKDGSQYLQSTSSLSQLSDPFMTASLSFTSQSTTLSERSSRFPSSIASPSTHTLQAFSRLLNRIRPIVSSFIHQLQLFYRLISAICSSFNLSVKQQTSSSSLSSLSQSPSFQSTSSAHFTSNASKENVSQNVSSIEIAHPMLKDLLDRLNFNGWITKLEEI